MKIFKDEIFFHGLKQILVSRENQMWIAMVNSCSFKTPQLNMEQIFDI